MNVRISPENGRIGKKTAHTSRPDRALESRLSNASAHRPVAWLAHRGPLHGRARTIIGNAGVWTFAAARSATPPHRSHSQSGSNAVPIPRQPAAPYACAAIGRGMVTLARSAVPIT